MLSVIFKLTSLFPKSLISKVIGELFFDKYICFVLLAPFSSLTYISYKPSSETSYTKFTSLLGVNSKLVPSVLKSISSFISSTFAIFITEIILFPLIA